MSLFDELKKFTKPPYDEEDDYIDGDPLDDDDDFPLPEPEEEHSSSRGGAFSGFNSSYGGSASPPRSSSRVSHTPARGGGKVVNIGGGANQGQLQVVLVKPERFESAGEIADHLREKRTVLMNLEYAQKDLARRLIDFLSGVAYAGDGKIKKVAASTYLITPSNVDIMGDLIDGLESGGLHF